MNTLYNSTNHRDGAYEPLSKVSYITQHSSNPTADCGPGLVQAMVLRTYPAACSNRRGIPLAHRQDFLCLLYGIGEEGNLGGQRH